MSPLAPSYQMQEVAIIKNSRTNWAIINTLAHVSRDTPKIAMERCVWRRYIILLCYILDPQLNGRVYSNWDATFATGRWTTINWFRIRNRSFSETDGVPKIQRVPFEWQFGTKRFHWPLAQCCYFHKQHLQPTMHGQWWLGYAYIVVYLRHINRNLTFLRGYIIKIEVKPLLRVTPLSSL
jgi:hypothetical protein